MKIEDAYGFTIPSGEGNWRKRPDSMTSFFEPEDGQLIALLINASHPQMDGSTACKLVSATIERFFNRLKNAYKNEDKTQPVQPLPWSAYEAVNKEDYSCIEHYFDNNKISSLLVEDGLSEAVQHAHSVLWDANNSARLLEFWEAIFAGAGTASVLAIHFYDDTASVVHIGSNPLYKIQNGAIKQLTKDHTLEQLSKDLGREIPEDFQYKHVISRQLLGMNKLEKAILELDCFEFKPQPQTTYLLASQRLCHHLPNDQIMEALTQDIGIVERLENLAGVEMAAGVEHWRDLGLALIEME